MFIVRRFMTALVLVSMRNTNIWVRCMFFCIVQFIALTFVIVKRPFESTKDNIIEIMNEVVFSIFCIIVSVCNRKSMWFKGLPGILIYSLMINGFMISFVVITDFVIGLVKKYKAKNKVHQLSKNEQATNSNLPRKKATITEETKQVGEHNSYDQNLSKMNESNEHSNER